MNKSEAFDEINKIQDRYVDELEKLINNRESIMKRINFTSPTGTGKTKMMSKLINRFPDCFFIVTTLSKGQLHLQIKENLEMDCNQKNFMVYGSADYKINSILEAQDIISKIPDGKKCIWLRDEGHIRTNRYEELLFDKCYRIINFSATNQRSDIRCNFTQTMMLRTVNQLIGDPEDAINRLIEIKKAHEMVNDYNPCAIFRCVGNNENLYKETIKLCKKYKLKYIDITNDPFDMADLCKDDNKYDVIINKFKIIEGIDIRRAHVLYMDNQPNNLATTIQAIGRCRRNALLYRNDIDILAPENEDLLKQTRECYVYYRIADTMIDSVEGEMQYAFCNYVSCQELQAGMYVDVTNGQLPNGLYVIELLGETGRFNIYVDKNTGFNIVEPEVEFYEKHISKHHEEKDYIIVLYPYNRFYKVYREDIIKFPTITRDSIAYYNVDVSYNNPLYKVFHELNDTELFMARNRYIRVYESNDLRVDDIDQIPPNVHYESYIKVDNDKESAVIGVDLMRQVKYDDISFTWIENSSISSKVNNFNKLNTYISNRYSRELCDARLQLFTGTNNFQLDKKCNSMLGYCVEYYSKYILYGLDYLEDIGFVESRRISYQPPIYSNIDDLLVKYGEDKLKGRYKYFLVHLCMRKYKQHMIRCFGNDISKKIRLISFDVLHKEYKQFVNLVDELGKKTAKFVKSTLYKNVIPKDDIDPDLSIDHIKGIADYITRDTILDVKVRNNIDEASVRQVLAYHYLSTKRSDLDIKRVIVYDAVSDKSVILNIC